MTQPETVNDTVLYALRNIHADQNVTVRMLDDATFDIWGQVFVNGNPVSGGGTFPIASQPEAEAGVDNTKVMTPLRVSQAITYQVNLGLYLPKTGGELTGNLSLNPGNLTIFNGDLDLLNNSQLTVVGQTNLRDTYFMNWNPAGSGAQLNIYMDGGKFFLTGSTAAVPFENFEFTDPVVIVADDSQLKLRSVDQAELYFESDGPTTWATIIGTTNGLTFNTTSTAREHKFKVNSVDKLLIGNTTITSYIDIIVPDEVYDATAWNGSLEVPTKNAVRDKIESLVLGGGSVTSVNGETGVVVLNQDEVLDGTTYKQYSATEKTKLSGVATGATANSSDATLLNRLNHTGTQSADTITDGSTNHVFTAADDTKLTGIATGATANSSDATLLARTNHTGSQAISTVANLQTELDARVDTTGNETIAGIKTFSSDPIIPDEAYSSSWNGVLEPPTKNAVYDKIETLGGGGASISDTVYGVGWDGDTTNGASKNAIYDKIEALDGLVAHKAGTETFTGAKSFNSTIDVNGIATFNTVIVDIGMQANGSIQVPDDAYAAGWDASTEVPTKNALYDKIQTLQPLDSDLTTIAGLTATTNNFLVSVSSAWASRTPAQVKTTLALDNVTNTSDANKPVSTAQQTALDLKVDKSQTINAQTGTSYTLVLTDATKLVTLSNAGAIALTVPTNASVAFPIGTRIDLVQKGAGQVTVGGTPTVNSTPTKKTRAQYSGMTLVKEDTDTWYLFGDLAAT